MTNRSEEKNYLSYKLLTFQTFSFLGSPNITICNVYLKWLTFIIDDVWSGKDIKPVRDGLKPGMDVTPGWTSPGWTSGMDLTPGLT